MLSLRARAARRVPHHLLRKGVVGRDLFGVVLEWKTAIIIFPLSKCLNLHYICAVSPLAEEMKHFSGVDPYFEDGFETTCVPAKPWSACFRPKRFSC